MGGTQRSSLSPNRVSNCALPRRQLSASLRVKCCRAPERLRIGSLQTALPSTSNSFPEHGQLQACAIGSLFCCD